MSKQHILHTVRPLVRQAHASHLHSSHSPFGAEVFVHGFGYKNFVVQYIVIPEYMICIFDYKIMRKAKRVSRAEADLATDVPKETVAEERARYETSQLAKEEAEGALPVWKIKSPMPIVAFLVVI